MNAVDALSLLRAQAIENISGVPSLFAWHRAGSMALGPKRIFAICQFLYIRGKSICQFLSMRCFNATP